MTKGEDSDAGRSYSIYRCCNRLADEILWNMTDEIGKIKMTRGCGEVWVSSSCDNNSENSYESRRALEEEEAISVMAEPMAECVLWSLLEKIEPLCGSLASVRNASLSRAQGKSHQPSLLVIQNSSCFLHSFLSSIFHLISSSSLLLQASNTRSECTEHSIKHLFVSTQKRNHGMGFCTPLA
jgi:hypothetical protein